METRRLSSGSCGKNNMYQMFMSLSSTWQILQISSRTQDLELQIQGYIAKGQICKLMTVGKSKWTGMTKFATIAIYTITTKCYLCCTNVLCDIGTILYNHDPVIVTKMKV